MYNWTACSRLANMCTTFHVLIVKPFAISGRTHISSDVTLPCFHFWPTPTQIYFKPYKFISLKKF